jgi:hypothetical protein
MQAATGRVGGGAQPLLVIAATEHAFVGLREPCAIVPHQLSVMELLEPHVPRPQQQCNPDGGGGMPAHAPVPLQPPATPRLQQRARDAAALVTDDVAARQGLQARLGGMPSSPTCSASCSLPSPHQPASPRPVPRRRATA